MATQAENKELVRRVLNASFDEANLKALEDLCKADYVHHTVMGDDVEGQAAFIAFVGSLHDTFDDLSFTIRTVIAEGDLVAVRGDISGVHIGEFQGIPATQESVKWKSYAFAQVDDGKLAESWVLSDAMGLLEQLGALGETATAG